ncbi:MAG TPA: LytTR family DNA-binding domain-containing protein [Saprospiraceae bacterium]|nr:LytTR family DNA-binding domain-containing protein [Saprospiraceae bacterium]HMP14771.1 LytTR family DNA-binding domain-containing protein [Saprospiraceae bacterium]
MNLFPSNESASFFHGIATAEEAAQIKLEMLYEEMQQLLQQLLGLLPANNVVGIPCMEGIEFLKPKEIIRCEGLQRLTKVYTETHTIISAYNIGEFNRLLCPFGFFTSHKSHLINLRYLRAYQVGGVIVLRNGDKVPLARRRKDIFLELVRHL